MKYKIDCCEVVDNNSIEVEFSTISPMSVDIIEINGQDSLCINPKKIPELIALLERAYGDYVNHVSKKT